MSIKTDAAILKMLPELTHTEVALLMALSQATSGGMITKAGYALVLHRVGLSEDQAHRVMAGLALHNLAHLQPPTADRMGTFHVRGGDEE